MPLPSPSETDLPVPFEDREPQVAPFPLVGVGASAGGLEAFSQFLEALPDDTGMAFVLIQHLDPTHKSELTAILARSTNMPVSEVIGGMPIESNHIYVIPPNTLLHLANRAFHLTPRSVSASPSLTIDHFFTSLAKEQSRLAMGVVLSGTGSDGAEGLKAIKSACGITFAQEERSAKYPSMPRNAAATGIVDFVLTPAQIAQELARLSRNQYVVSPAGQDTPELLPEGNAELQEIFALLYRSTGVDFSRYKQPTMRRRISRRMVVHRLIKLQEYVTFLRQHPEEIKELFRDALINVTSFFRDPDAFAALAAQLSLSLPTKELTGNPFRVWVAGCSTGEEVYSLAISLYELFEAAGLPLRLQLFGTDLSEGALAIARSGLYPERIQEELSRERLNRYFTKTDGKFQINKAIRDTCVFAKHDVTHDTPFSQLDLISCRNVLIYLDAVLQQGLFPTFHYGLRPNGFLFLGTAEAIGSSTDLFTVVDAKQKIFRRQPGPARLDRFSTWHAPAASTFTEVQVATAAHHQRLGNQVERMIRERYAPDGVVINREWQILQFRGHTGFYLEPAPGEASYHLLRMARGDLAYSLRDVISAAMQQNSFVEKGGIRVEQGGESREIAVEVSPLDGDSPSDSCYLVVFRREGTQTVSSRPPLAPPLESTDRRVERLEQELAAARRYQQAISEEHDAALEELRALNEELRSANEELQSSNEEIGTTKEELQSSNEELTTLNEELDTRNQQLGLVNDDLNNLFAATPSPLLKVDREFYLRRCTSAAERLGITAADLNHPVRDLQSRLGTLPDLESSIRQVIDTLTGQTCEFQDREGCWWSLSLRPYRTGDHRIEGAVLTFTETDKIQRALHASDQARRAADAIIETVREPFVIVTPDLRVERANASFYQFFQVTPAQTEGQLLGELGNGHWDLPLLRTQLEQVLPNHGTLTDFEVTYTRPGRETRMLLLNVRQMSQATSEPEAILLAFEDVTERRNRELESARQIQETGQELDRSKEELRALANSVITAREEEARRIARELHDDFSQRLAFLKIAMERDRRGPLGKNHPEMEAALTRFEGQIAELSNDVRNLSHRLHPTMLDDLGLTAALRNLAEEAELVRSAPVQFRAEEVSASLPPSYAAALYRIAQEALRNATKHAPDAPVTIALNAKAGVLRLTISDTGPGFNPTVIRGTGGLGIVTMQERAHLVGGELRLRSEPGQGTTITVEIPWSTEGDDDRTPADHRG